MTAAISPLALSTITISDSITRSASSRLAPTGSHSSRTRITPAGDPNLPDLVPLGDIRFFDFSYGGAVDVTLDAIPEFDGDGSPWDPGRFVEPFYGQGGDGVPLVDGLGDLAAEK